MVVCCYLDFANAFNSVDHEALWRWLRELNMPDVDLLYHESSYVADLPYGQSASIRAAEEALRLHTAGVVLLLPYDGA